MLLLNKYKISAGGDYLAQEKNQENFFDKMEKTKYEFMQEFGIMPPEREGKDKMASADKKKK